MSYRCVVIVREVWDTRDLTGQVLESGAVKSGALAGRFEPEDLNALEMALRIKDEQGGTVTAVTVGATRDVDVLRECLYRGADDTLCVDADPAGLDTQARAALLAGAIQSIDGVDLVLTGVTVADGENGALGAQVAALMGIQQVSYVDELVQIGDGKVVARRAIEMGYEDVQVALPALLSVGVALVEDDPRTPRSAKAMLKLKAKKAQIPTKTSADVGVPDPAGVVTTAVAAMEEIPERVIESREVDPEDESALQTMLTAVLKGD